ncbi:MAG TPA: DUF6599 family protein [Phycisphaerae bacterium]|nr:DUF6599 family protein [Phycisphaerae bacterium]
MPTLFARRYRRAYVGPLEKALGVLIFVALAALVAAFVGQFLTGPRPSAIAQGSMEPGEAAGVTAIAGKGSAADAETAGPNPFPDAGAADWKAPAQASHYTPDNLYMKIDGRADLYLQYHVVAMTFGTYAHASDPQRTIDVYWYDLGQPDNAQGIYRTEAPPDATAVPVGRQGYQGGGAVFFVKGSHYVQVLPTGPDESDGAAALTIAGKIAQLIQDAAGDEWAPKVLPAKGRVEGSIEFAASDVFDLDFLANVYTADYEHEGGRIKLFIHRAENDAAAAAVFEKYKEFFGEFGKIIWTDPDTSRCIVAGEASDVIDAVFVKGRYLGGVSAADDLETAKKAAREFYDAIAP